MTGSKKRFEMTKIFNEVCSSLDKWDIFGAQNLFIRFFSNYT